MRELEEGINRSDGHCTVMGTASTMAAMAEALGLALPGTAAIPAPDARRPRVGGGGRPRDYRNRPPGHSTRRCPDPAGIRKRDPAHDGAGRVDERGDPPHGHC